MSLELGCLAVGGTDGMTNDVISRQLQVAIKIKGELEKQLAESHCAVQFVYPL